MGNQAEPGGDAAWPPSVRNLRAKFESPKSSMAHESSLPIPSNYVAPKVSDTVAKFRNVSPLHQDEANSKKQATNSKPALKSSTTAFTRFLATRDQYASRNSFTPPAYYKGIVPSAKNTVASSSTAKAIAIRDEEAVSNGSLNKNMHLLPKESTGKLSDFSVDSNSGSETSSSESGITSGSDNEQSGADSHNEDELEVHHDASESSSDGENESDNKSEAESCDESGSESDEHDSETDEHSSDTDSNEDSESRGSDSSSSNESESDGESQSSLSDSEDQSGREIESGKGNGGSRIESTDRIAKARAGGHELLSHKVSHGIPATSQPSKAAAAAKLRSTSRKFARSTSQIDRNEVVVPVTKPDTLPASSATTVRETSNEPKPSLLQRRLSLRKTGLLNTTTAHKKLTKTDVNALPHGTGVSTTTESTVSPKTNERIPEASRHVSECVSDTNSSLKNMPGSKPPFESLDTKLHAPQRSYMRETSVAKQSVTKSEIDGAAAAAAAASGNTVSKFDEAAVEAMGNTVGMNIVPQTNNTKVAAKGLDHLMVEPLRQLPSLRLSPQVNVKSTEPQTTHITDSPVKGLFLKSRNVHSPVLAGVRGKPRTGNGAGAEPEPQVSPKNFYATDKLHEKSNIVPKQGENFRASTLVTGSRSLRKYPTTEFPTSDGGKANSNQENIEVVKSKKDLPTKKSLSRNAHHANQSMGKRSHHEKLGVVQKAKENSPSRGTARQTLASQHVESNNNDAKRNGPSEKKQIAAKRHSDNVNRSHKSSPRHGEPSTSVHHQLEGVISSSKNRKSAGPTTSGNRKAANGTHLASRSHPTSAKRGRKDVRKKGKRHSRNKKEKHSSKHDSSNGEESSSDESGSSYSDSDSASERVVVLAKGGKGKQRRRYRFDAEFEEPGPSATVLCLEMGAILTVIVVVVIPVAFLVMANRGMIEYTVLEQWGIADTLVESGVVTKPAPPLTPVKFVSLATQALSWAVESSEAAIFGERDESSF